MTHDEQREYLIEALLKEETQYADIKIPADTDQQKNLLRSLMNVRPPRPVSEEFLKIQDEYLSEEVRRKGMVDVKTLEPVHRDRRMFLWKGDITALKADAIVNAANSALLGCFHPCHSCIDNIIHSLSGIQLRLTCAELMKRQGHEEPTGTAKITPAFNLPCTYVLHTVGPIVWGELTKTHIRQLADCYRSCLKLVTEYGLKSVAFCCISTGEFHFPQEKAAEIAIQTVTEYLKEDTQIERVIFNVFKQEDYEIYKRRLS